MGVGGGRRLGDGVRIAAAAALLLLLAGLMAAPAWAQSEEGTVETTDASVEESQSESDAGREEKAEKKSNKDVEVDVGDDGVSVRTDNVSAEVGNQTDDQAQEDDDTTRAATLDGLTAAEVQNLSCVVVLQYAREVVDFDIDGDQYQFFSALERRAIECQRTAVVGGTVPGGKLPITGGLPLVGGGALLALALVGTGISIARAGARRR
jgi:hypothetical protein